MTHGVGVSTQLHGELCTVRAFVVLGLSDRQLEEARKIKSRSSAVGQEEFAFVVSELHASDFSAPHVRCHAVTGRWVARRTSFGRRVWRLA